MMGNDGLILPELILLGHVELIDDLLGKVLRKVLKMFGDCFDN